MILKVFPDGSTGANSDDILAALEDCVTLGVDVVNLSLGSPAGFTYRSDLLSTMEVYDRLAKAGIIVAAAAGNEYSAAYKNLWGTDLSLTSNPDYGIVGSPSSYSQTLSVASADNVTVRSAYFEAAGRKITFTDTATTNNPEGGFIRVLGGKTLDYVVVPGNGEEADYANLNVKGKVALVSRGVTTFAEKHEMAHVKGAAACIVYNTEAGMINMSIDSFPIPAIFISQADGQAMVAAAKDGVGTLTVSNSTYDAPSETGGQPSSFSSWGSTSQLEITPDIMAPGGNIYSSRDNNSYGLMSGTSMDAASGGRQRADAGVPPHGGHRGRCHDAGLRADDEYGRPGQGKQRRNGVPAQAGRRSCKPCLRYGDEGLSAGRGQGASEAGARRRS